MIPFLVPVVVVKDIAADAAELFGLWRHAAVPALVGDVVAAVDGVIARNRVLDHRVGHQAAVIACFVQVLEAVLPVRPIDGLGGDFDAVGHEVYPHAARALAGGVVVVTPGLGAGDLDFLLGRVHVDNVVAVVVGAVAAGQVDFLDGVDDGVTVLVVARDTLKIVGPVVFCGHDPGHVAKGGTSVYGNDKVADMLFMPAVLEQHGLGNFTNSDLSKLLAGKQVSLNITLDDYLRSLSGSTTPKDLKTYIEMIYMTFTGLIVTNDEFTAMQNLYKGLIQNQEQNPNFVFQKRVQEFLYASPNKQIFSVSDIEKANRENILGIIREQLANAAEFTFVFSGNFDEAELKSLTEQYIASLPSVKGKKAEVKYNSAVEIKVGNEQKEFTMKMEVPQGNAAVIISGKMPYSFKNRLMASMSAQIISTRLISEVREKEGAVYSIYTQGSQDRVSKMSTVYQTVFPVKPEKKDRALEIIRNEFEKLAKETPVEELNKVKEFMVKQYAENEHTNSYWCSIMAGNELKPSEICVKAEQTIQSITPKELSKYVNEVMKQNNYRVLVMMPEK